MQQFSSTIHAIERIGRGQVRCAFSAPWKTAPQPGQFVSVESGGGTLLKRPFSLGSWKDGIAEIFVKTVGPGSCALAELKPGNEITVLGPLGKGFPAPEKDQKMLYIGGGCGIPPLLFHASVHHENERIAFAGFRSAPDIILEQAFKDIGAQYHAVTEDGSAGRQGMVTDILKKYLDSEKGDSIIMASGPMPMLKAVTAVAQTFSLPAYLCLERYMACGFGVCNGCVQTVIDDSGNERFARVCVDGPVFKADAVKWE